MEALDVINKKPIEVEDKIPIKFLKYVANIISKQLAYISKTTQKEQVRQEKLPSNCIDIKYK